MLRAAGSKGLYGIPDPKNCSQWVCGETHMPSVFEKDAELYIAMHFAAMYTDSGF